MSNLPPGVTQAMVDRSAGVPAIEPCVTCRQMLGDGEGIETKLNVAVCSDECLSVYVTDKHDEIVEFLTA